MKSICKKCAKEFIPSKGLISYCSLTCRNSRTWTEDDKTKKSNSAKKSEKVKNVKKTIIYSNGRDLPKCYIAHRNCTYCNKLFISSRDKYLNQLSSTTCSDICYLKVKKLNYSGRKLLYNGLEFDSTWEVITAKLLDELNIKWVKNPLINYTDKQGICRRYYPDFYLPLYNVYIDPKNIICIQKQIDKLDIVSKDIHLVYGHIDMIKEYIKRLISSTE